MHVLSLPPAFVLSQDQTLKLRSSISALITLGSLIARLGTERSELTRTYTPEHQPKPAPKVTILETCPPMSIYGPRPTEADPGPRTSPPTFLFLLIQLSKSRSRNRSWFFSDQLGRCRPVARGRFLTGTISALPCCVPRPRSLSSSSREPRSRPDRLRLSTASFEVIFSQAIWPSAAVAPVGVRYLGNSPWTVNSAFRRFGTFLAPASKCF